MTEPGGEPERSGRDWLEIFATIILSLAAVATTWSSYQATRWNGETTKTTSQVNAARIDAARAAARANAETEVDVASFIQWVDARAHDDEQLQTFYLDRFRDEFRTAFDAWLATDPLDDPDAPPTPFAMEEYRLASATAADELDAKAEALSGTVRTNVQRAGNYVLGVVLFAVAMFFAGTGSRLSGGGSRTALLAVSLVLFIGTIAWIATFPISVSV
jgi:hypothetical protein